MKNSDVFFIDTQKTISFVLKIQTSRHLACINKWEFLVQKAWHVSEICHSVSLCICVQFHKRKLNVVSNRCLWGNFVILSKVFHMVFHSDFLVNAASQKTQKFKFSCSCHSKKKNVIFHLKRCTMWNVVVLQNVFHAMRLSSFIKGTTKVAH